VCAQGRRGHAFFSVPGGPGGVKLTMLRTLGSMKDMQLAQDNNNGDLMLLGAPLMDAVDLGYLKRVGRGIKRGARGAKRGVKSGTRVVVKAGKTAVQLHKLALKLALAFAIRLGKVICATPEGVLRIGAASAGVNFDIVPLFCQALRVRNIATIRANLPAIIKLALKLTASSAVPGLGPVLATMKFVPGLSKFAGAPLAASLGHADDTYLGNWSEAEIANEIASMADSEIADALGLPGDEIFGRTPTVAGTVVFFSLAGLAIGYSTYTILRK